MNNDDTKAKSVTIMKYQAKDDKYYFIVKDKFDITDEVERLDYMNSLKDEMLASGEMKKFLWIKETVLF
jgi:5-formaminoimidazole-4-carboxamide-1-beta-D-ribofuranosyl 5'-monophosphate synthetase